MGKSSGVPKKVSNFVRWQEVMVIRFLNSSFSLYSAAGGTAAAVAVAVAVVCLIQVVVEDDYAAR